MTRAHHRRRQLPRHVGETQAVDEDVVAIESLARKQHEVAASGVRDGIEHVRAREQSRDRHRRPEVPVPDGDDLHGTAHPAGDPGGQLLKPGPHRRPGDDPHPVHAVQGHKTILPVVERVQEGPEGTHTVLEECPVVVVAGRRDIAPGNQEELVGSVAPAVPPLPHGLVANGPGLAQRACRFGGPQQTYRAAEVVAGEAHRHNRERQNALPECVEFTDGAVEFLAIVPVRA